MDLLGGYGQTAVQVDLIPSIDGLPSSLCKPPRAISIGFLPHRIAGASDARVRCAITLVKSSICSPAAEAAQCVMSLSIVIDHGFL